MQHLFTSDFHLQTSFTHNTTNTGTIPSCERCVLLWKIIQLTVYSSAKSKGYKCDLSENTLNFHIFCFSIWYSIVGIDSGCGGDQR